MEPQQFMVFLITGLIIIAIVLIPAQNLLGGENVVEKFQGNVTRDVTIDVVDETSTVDKVIVLGGGYFYKVNLNLNLKVTSRTGEQIDVVPVIKFKGQSLFAKVVTNTGEEDKFTADPAAGWTAFSVELNSDMPPLVEFSNGNLRSGFPVIVRSNTNAPVILTAYLDYAPYDFTVRTLSRVCRAYFSVECVNEKPYTGYMRGCVFEGGKEKDCEQTLDACGGTVEIRVPDDPDCGENRVFTEATYSGTKEFAVGETLSITFFRDDGCVRRYADVDQMKVLCPGSYIGGKPRINIGVLQVA